MNILFIHSDKISLCDLQWVLYENNIETDNYPNSISIEHYDEEERKELLLFLKKKQYELVLTYDFSAVVADACYECSVKYASWVFDSPQLALYTPSARHKTNYVFVFDKIQYNRMQEFGIKNLFYLPLGANLSRVSGVVITEEDEKKYGNDISFVGNFYENNGYNQYLDSFTPEIKQKLSSIIEENVLHWGDHYGCYNKFDPQFVEELERTLHIAPEEGLEVSSAYLYETYFLSRKMTEIDRICILNALAINHRVTVYTSSSGENLQGVRIRGQVSYDEEAPKIFYLSKINLNITLRSIESGAIQRIFDIMSAGGFVISNYQEELEELFVPGQEIVLFRNIEELITKVDYYLKHEKERIQIAMNGYKKVRDCYTVEKAVKTIIKNTVNCLEQ